MGYSGRIPLIMAKYDAQLTELKNLLPTAKSILIALPANASIDNLASGLALFLTLEASGKQVSIVCDDTIKVGQSHLYGVDHVQKNIPQTDGGNLTLTLEGVAASNNTVPALEKLDWYAEGSNLNLVFHVLQGQTFQPAKIVPKYQGSGFSLIFAIGAVNLNSLGALCNQNQQVFSGTHLVNIDTQSANTGFGQTNVLDTNASCLSEVMSSLLSDLGFALDSDSASNLLAGIFDATGNLADGKVGAETFMAVANCLRVGGRKPVQAGVQASPQVQTQPTPSEPAFDWNSLMPAPPAPTSVQPVSEFTVPPVVPASPVSSVQVAPQPSPPIESGSPEERPAGEAVLSETPEPDWLTPKIFKGSSLG